MITAIMVIILIQKSFVEGLEGNANYKIGIVWDDWIAYFLLVPAPSD